MQNVLPEGGMIRRFWVSEVDKYRDHLLRLDSVSRRNRFGGGVSDETIHNYVDSAHSTRHRDARLLHRRSDAWRGGAATAWR